MQHYGIPTRLLDWSESPQVALYFALHDSSNFIASSGYIDDCAVWIVDPMKWNNHSLNLDVEVGIVSTDEDYINGYKPLENVGGTSIRRKLPIAITGRKSNPRIVAQRGVFMIFGTDTSDMESMYANNGYPEDCLMKIIVPLSKIEDMRGELYRAGVTDSAIYPDLLGLATEIKRRFGY